MWRFLERQHHERPDGSSSDWYIFLAPLTGVIDGQGYRKFAIEVNYFWGAKSETFPAVSTD